MAGPPGDRPTARPGPGVWGYLPHRGPRPRCCGTAWTGWTPVSGRRRVWNGCTGTPSAKDSRSAAGGGWKNEADFPKVDFWRPDREPPEGNLQRETSRAEAARVLIELREVREDQREWVAAGHPDPLAVGAGRHPGGQWVLRYSDLKPASPEGQPAAAERLLRTRDAAGAWKDNQAAEELQREIAARRTAFGIEPGQ